jgi:X-Pro dipeptidyl-peptidase
MRSLPAFTRTVAGLAIAFALAACASGTPAPAAAPAATTAPEITLANFVDGMAQVMPMLQDSTSWVRQDLWVETDFDSDRDGRNDRIHVDVTRPGPAGTYGVRVPVIYRASPYFAGTAGFGAEGFWNPRQELDGAPTPRNPVEKPAYRGDRHRISNALVNQWVPRGFAVVHSSQPGTGLSQGCPTVGDYPERAPMKFVIDWLNGRARGYTAPVGGDTVNATSWSTGKVGMIGTSYEGTLPLAAATTGVDGLEMVVPVSPNTSYYHYYRSNGLVRSPGGYLGEDVDVLYDFVASGDTATRAACDRIWKNGIFANGQDRRTGDYNEFWRVRDLLPLLKNVHAAVLLAHGLHDYNVMPEHSVRIYDELERLGRPVSLFLHRGGHGGNPPADMLNRWFSHYLYGVPNGVESDPPVWIMPPEAPRAVGTGAGAPAGASARAARVIPEPAPFASFPVPGTEAVVLHPASGGSGIAPLSLSAGSGRETFVDDVRVSGPASASAAQSTHRLLYATPPLTADVHVSGTPRVTLRVSSSAPAANLSVWLVTLPYDSSRAGSASHEGNIALGWADIRNHASLTDGGNYDSERPGAPLVPGTFYDVTFDLQPTDATVRAGQRLAVMIMSSDREFTLWPRPGTELTVDLAGSSFRIPIGGGAGALRGAGVR